MEPATNAVIFKLSRTGVYSALGTPAHSVHAGLRPGGIDFIQSRDEPDLIAICLAPDNRPDDLLHIGFVIGTSETGKAIVVYE